MSDKETLLRQLPGVDILLNHSAIKAMTEKVDAHHVTEIIRSIIAEKRNKILQGHLIEVSSDLIIEEVKNAFVHLNTSKLVSLFNCTGVILHTNLGRAPLGKDNIEKSLEILQGYSNLEFDLEKGKRGKRKSPIQSLLQNLTGADDVAIVNNNAAAVYLCLKAFAQGGEAIVSRGELVEIGGSFRIPDIMAQSGAHLVEVGATNRTRLSDYENAITDQTKVILKAHQSNFYQEGFTEEVSIKELAQLAEKHNLIFIYDLGCGLIKNFESVKFLDQPSVQENINDDADLVLFSGDKLLGGPQCGIIAGKQKYLKVIDKHPLMRAFRVDKMTLATLQVTLSNYLNADKLTNIPFYKYLFRTNDSLESLANKFSEALKSSLTENEVAVKVIANKGKCGGGTTPNIKLDTFAVALSHADIKPHDLFHALLQNEKPTVGILKEGQFLLDVLCIEEKDIPVIVQNVKQTVCNILS